MEDVSGMQSGNSPETHILQTARLLLAVPHPNDASRMAKYVQENREHLSGWEPIRSDEYYTQNFWEAELGNWFRECQEERSLRFILLDRSDPQGPILGQCNFTNIVRGPFQACHLGYSIDFRSEGKGLMLEALSEAITYVFGRLGLHRVMANYMPTNERSGKLLRRLNFVVEGYARDYLFLAGAWQDHILTSLTSAFEKK